MQIKNKLFILSDSLNPDIYINIIVSSVRQFKVKEVELIHILDEDNESENKLSMSSKILKQFELILEGKYNLYNYVTGTYTVEELEGYNDDIYNFYKKSYDVFAKHVNENNVTLNEFFYIIKKIKNSTDFLFDITGLKKDMLTNLIPVFIENNIMHDIYYFERQTLWKYNQFDLLHNIQQSEMKYDKILKDRTILYLTEKKSVSKKRTFFFGFTFLIIIGSFGFILAGNSIDVFGVIGTVASFISLIPSAYDWITKQKNSIV